MAKKLLKMTITRTFTTKPYESFKIEAGTEYEVEEDNFDNEQEDTFVSLMQFLVDKEEILRKLYTKGMNDDG